jgi:2-succinyl-5-enolpyruvyl-6-hydroxy-3-cyclohexene-1-carboxylate synthase
MINSAKRNVRALVSLAKQKGITHVVFSPGSRNAPLIIGFTGDAFFTCISIPDERSAAFIALGLIQATGKPVLVCCTSGSAAVNYYPAITEAFYQRLPLLVVTADRPPEWIDQADGQTIRQVGVFKNHIGYEANLPKDTADLHAHDFADLALNEALNTALVNQLPVHINMPFEEPLYGTFTSVEETFRNIAPETINYAAETHWASFAEEWNAAEKKIILVGQLPPNSGLDADLERLAEDPGTVIFTESLSNIHVQGALPAIDRVINTLTDADMPPFTADILLTLGDAVVSKKIKTLLRSHRPKAHWHVGAQLPHPDTYQALTHSVHSTPQPFVNFLANAAQPTQSTFGLRWREKHEARIPRHAAFLADCPWSDHRVFHILLNQLPREAVVHLGNSSAVRYAQLFTEGRQVPHLCNRGTSGIDGSTSTALGYALASNKLNILISGDVSFFYDSNAFFNRYVPANLRVIVLSNGGGNIFRIIPGPTTTPVFEEFFESAHNANVAGVAQTFGLDYGLVVNETELIAALPKFFQPNAKAAILEIKTPNKVNPQILENYFNSLKHG